MDSWDSGHAYEQYVGRWSRQVAPKFLHWLALPPGLAWADIGCGTGVLSAAILSACSPSSVHGVDKSNGFLSVAKQRILDPRATFDLGDAAQLPWEANVYDAAVSGLAINFVPDPDETVREMARVTRPGGVVAIYLWDYAEGMQMMRHFWDAVVAISPHDARFDEGERFPLCRPEPLKALFENAGLRFVTVTTIDIPTVFQDFDDYWNPFLGGTGSAPAYLASVSDEVREKIRLHVQARLAPSQDGTIKLTARAWAVRGRV